MARARTETLLPLDQWAEQMGFNPFQFNQIGKGIDYGKSPQCPTVWYQHQWQKQFLSLDEIALAIRKAEEALARVLNYYPAPRWVTNEVQAYPKDFRLDTPDWMTARGQWKRIQTNWQHLQSLGTLKRTLIDDNVPTSTRSDDDEDNVEDHFTLSVSSTETDVQKLAVYFSATDRGALDETWRILPLTIVANGTTITFKGRLSQIVRPVLRELPNPVELDAKNGEIYATTLDVYKMEADSAGIGTAYWDETVGVQTPTSGTIDSASPITDADSGHFRPMVQGVYTVGQAPNRLLINYYAGVLREADGRMREPYASMVSYLACQYLPSLSCGCDRADQQIKYWRAVPSDGESGNNRPMVAREIEENIFGTSRGAVYAWQMAQLLENPAGVTL